MKRLKTTRFFALALASVLVGMTSLVSPASAQDTARITYTRLGDIFTMASDGSDKIQLTSGAAFDYFPQWSPDASKIVFVRCCSVHRPGYTALVVINADGSDPHVVTTDLRGRVLEASWSPDGASIGYADVITESNRHRAAIKVVAVDGSSTTSLTNYRKLNVGALWSPDGTRISFMSDRDGDTELFLMDPDGSNKIKLTDDPGLDFMHQWSPDGSKIAWVRESEEYGWSSHLYVMNSDGSEQVRLTQGNQLDEVPQWSPDGSMLAFTRWQFEPEFDTGLWVVNADGSEPKRLAAADDGASWSPDGTRIAFGHNRDIFTVGVDGTALLRVTTQRLFEGDPDWANAQGGIDV